jgi:hypothetical protein
VFVKRKNPADAEFVGETDGVIKTVLDGVGVLLDVGVFVGNGFFTLLVTLGVGVFVDVGVVVGFGVFVGKADNE